MRRLGLALGAVLSVSVLLLTSCGGGAPAAPAPLKPSVTLSTSSLTFADQQVGTTSGGQTVVVTNNGQASLSISGVSVTGDFTQTTSCGTSLAVGVTCQIVVRFMPTDVGSRTGALSISDNASGSPQTVNLTGTGTPAAPAVSLSPASLTFASQPVGTTSSPKTVTLTNTGGLSLTVTGITASTGFGQTNTCGTSVAAGAQCTISATFTPTAAGATSGTLTITDDAANSPQMVSLSGTGIVTSVTVSGTATKEAVNGATATLYAVNSNGSNGAVLGTSTTDASGNFKITLNSAPSGPVRVVVSGGTFTSEWDGSTVTSTSGVSLVLDSLNSSMTNLSVTAASTFVDSAASGSLSSGKSTSFTAAHAAAESLMVGFYGLSSGTNIETLMPSFAASDITANPNSYTLGMVIGTLTAEGKALNSSDPDSLTSALSSDISDGVWDGRSFGKPVPFGSGDLPITAGTSDFAGELGTYASSSNETTKVNPVTISQVSPLITSVQTGVASCPCTPPAVGLAASSSGAVNSIAFVPTGSTTTHQFLFLAAHTSGVVVIDITDPTLSAPPVKAWPQVYYNQPGSGGFGSTAVGGIAPFVGNAGHPQVLAYAYGSKHVIVLNADTLVTGTPGTSNPVDAEMDVPIKATSQASFSGGQAYIGSAVPLGGSVLGLATADGYMVFDAAQVPSGNPVLKVYPVGDTNEELTENLGADVAHRYLLAGNEDGGVQLVDLSAGVTSGTSYYVTPSNFSTDFPGTTSTVVDANAVDQAVQAGILTFEHTPDTELINMGTIAKTPSTGSGVLPMWAPAAGGVAHVLFLSAPPPGKTSPLDITGSAVDATTHLVGFMSEFVGDIAVGQLQNPASVAAGGTWQGLTDWSAYVITNSPSLASFAGGGDPHANGVVYNFAKGTPYGYNLDGSTYTGVVQIDLAGFLKIPRLGTAGDAAHEPKTDPTTAVNTSTGGKVMQEITWMNPLVVTSTSLPIGNVGIAYTATLAAMGGTLPYSWSLTGGTLPAGLAMDGSGNITGTPTTVGTSKFTVTVFDSTTPTPMQASAAVVISIEPPPPSITTTSLSPATLGSAYSATLAATAGTAPYTWSISSGALPAGLSLNASTGAITGTPTVAGVASFMVTVTDSSTPTPQVASASLSITVNNTVPLSVSSTLPAGTIYVGYRGPVQFTGGTPPFTWTITSGTVPTGLTFDTSAGVISGVPMATGTTTVTVSATDSTSPTPVTSSATVTITINAAPNNALLKGQYAFLMNGFDTSGGPVVMAGSFTADGAGNITGGLEDINNSTAPTTSLAFTGKYSVGSDNRGGMVITNTNGTFTFLFSVGSISSGVATKARIEEFDSSGVNVTGKMQIQNSAAFSPAALKNSFAFGIVGGNSTFGRFAAGGVFSADGTASLSSGEMDYNNAGLATSAVSFTGSYAVASTGRGTGSFTLPTGTVNFAFYVVGADQLYLVSTDPISTSVLSSVFSGQARAQAGGPFSNSSLKGIAVFSTAGQLSPTNSDVQVGLLTFDGAGNYTLSSDQNTSGFVFPNTSSGTYSVAANGRVTVTPSYGSAPVVYLIAPNAGFLGLTDSEVTAGQFEPQSAGPFTNASFSGNYFFGVRVGAAASTGTEMSSGVVTSNGTGSLSGTNDSNTGGTLDPATTISDTYSVSSTGRVTLGSGEMLFYIVSPTKVVGINSSSKNTQPTVDVVEQ